MPKKGTSKTTLLLNQEIRYTDLVGSDRTGNCLVRMKLHQEILEWLPLEGMRVKV